MTRPAQQIRSAHVRWIEEIVLWSDALLFVLAFALAWFLIGTPAEAKSWPAAPQLFYRIVACIAVVAGIVTVRWRRPIGFSVTILGYGFVAASRVFSSGAMLLAFAGLLTVASIFIAEALSRLSLPRRTGTDR